MPDVGADVSHYRIVSAIGAGGPPPLAQQRLASSGASAEAAERTR
jgi:hypothetical protein